jgi:hypothetical protein
LLTPEPANRVPDALGPAAGLYLRRRCLLAFHFILHSFFVHTP